MDTEKYKDLRWSLIDCQNHAGFKKAMTRFLYLAKTELFHNQDESEYLFSINSGSNGMVFHIQAPFENKIITINSQSEIKNSANDFDQDLYNRYIKRLTGYKQKIELNNPEIVLTIKRILYSIFTGDNFETLKF